MAGQSKGVGRAGHGSEFFWWKAVKHGKRPITMLDVQNTARVLGFDESYFKNNNEEKNIIQKYKGVLENSSNVEEFKRKWRAILKRENVPQRLSAARASSQPAPTPATLQQEKLQELELVLAEREQFLRMDEREMKKKLAELEDHLDRAKMVEHELESSKIVIGIKEGAENRNADMVDVQPDIPFMIREERNPAVLKLEASDLQSLNHNPYVVDAKPASTPPVATLR